MDFPLSVAADTALLPLTIAETIALTLRRGKGNSDAE
jgi:uncharacterized protein YceK